jgi:hypothetical protein
MTSQQARETIRRYEDVLAEEDRRGARRDPSLLPATKANVMKAIKIEIAQLFYIGSASDEMVQPLIRAAMFLDSFTHEPLDTVRFVETMQRRRAELEGFREELLGIGRDAPYYWQRIHALTGPAEEEKDETFFDTVKRKLGWGAKETSTTRTSTVPQPAGRIELD